MHISKVKTCFKIADVRYIKNSTKLKFEYLKEIKDENGNVLPQTILKDNFARVYIITVDGTIKKIGGSQSTGGIKSTLQIYQDGGKNGRPSIRSVGIWYFLYHTILQGKKIEFYMIYEKNFTTNIKGLLGTHKIENAYISYKLIEQCCISDYKKIENGNFPDWNIQEQNGDWSDEIKTEHANIMTKSITKTTNKKRKIINLNNK